MNKSDIITWLRSEAKSSRINAKRAITPYFHDVCMERANMLTAAADWMEEHEHHTV